MTGDRRNPEASRGESLFAVLGAGSWGTALAMQLMRAGAGVVLWGLLAGWWVRLALWPRVRDSEGGLRLLASAASLAALVLLIGALSASGSAQETSVEAIRSGSVPGISVGVSSTTVTRLPSAS